MITIVVVAGDDHVRALAEFVKTVLSEVSRDQAQVLPAGSADEVLNILGREHIDLLMTDDRLPDMTGLELVRWLRPGLVGAVKILLTNDSRLLADPWKFAGAEINAVLARPLGREPLRLALNRWLGLPLGATVNRPIQSRAPGQVPNRFKGVSTD
jgi:CheY-like chemotaxis protein